MTGGTTNATTPPPLYHNLRGTNQPATSNSENGAPPSYEEAINPNGNIFHHIFCFYNKLIITKTSVHVKVQYSHCIIYSYSTHR